MATDIRIHIAETNGVAIAEIHSEGGVFVDAQSAAEVLVNCMYQGADAVVVRAENLPAAFFELRTGLAGEVLQKFSTYRGRLAIVGDFSAVESGSLRDFIRESNRVGRIVFVGTVEEGRERLSMIGR